MEPSYDRNVVKCPNCKDNINISVGRYPGGINDYGGWVLECAMCAKKFQISVKNPDDLSSVVSGASVVASWDDEMENKAGVLAAHGLSDAEQVERLLIKEFGEPDDFYDLTSRSLYQCGSCKAPIDAVAYADFRTKLGQVRSAIGSHLNFLLASRESAPDGASVQTTFLCTCGAEHHARFYRKFSEAGVDDVNEFWLINVDGAQKALDIDGIYSRDDCIALLEKLLLRWRATHNAVLLAAPFIGFNYPGARKKIPDLWNWVLNYTDPEKTAIITRKATFNLLKDTAKDSEMDVEFLKSWGLLNPTLETLDEKKAFFKTDFHAKFYCGMSADHVEVLVGSFNIHEGSYVENIHLLRYEFPDFARRYLLGMKMFFDTELLKKQRSILQIQIEDGRVASCRVVRYEGSLDSTPLP
jgi:hypothetical protein